MRRLFVTGTDTAVGKTTAACALLAAARGQGLRALAAKPVESGCEPDGSGQLVAADAEALARAASGQDAPRPPPGSVYRLRAPLAPSVAAALEGRALHLAPMLRACHRLASLAPDLFLVEGAGGLLVPLTGELFIADLAAALGYPLLVVARDSLGTINHALLTVEAARRRGLEVAAVLLSGVTAGPPPEDAARNAEQISRLGHVRAFHLPHGAPAAVADAILRAL